MNRKKLLDLIGLISKVNKHKVDMRYAKCGTAACLAGHHFIKNAPMSMKMNPRYGWGIVRGWAKADLDLDEATTGRLFEPKGLIYLDDNRQDTIKERAIAELTHLFNHGWVREDWYMRDEPFAIEKLNPELLKEVCDVTA